MKWSPVLHRGRGDTGEVRDREALVWTAWHGANCWMEGGLHTNVASSKEPRTLSAADESSTIGFGRVGLPGILRGLSILPAKARADSVTDILFPTVEQHFFF